VTRDQDRLDLARLVCQAEPCTAWRDPLDYLSSYASGKGFIELYQATTGRPDPVELEELGVSGRAWRAAHARALRFRVFNAILG